MSPRKAPPAFQLYAAEFLALTAELTAEELGIVMRLLCYEWLQGALPDDLARLARMAALAPGDLKRCWTAIDRHFPKLPDGTRGAEWLEAYRQELAEWRRKQAEGGRRGAERRWRGAAPDDGSAMGKPMGHPMGQPMGSDGSSTPSSSLSLTSSSPPTSTAPKVKGGLPEGELKTGLEAAELERAERRLRHEQRMRRIRGTGDERS